MKSRIAAILLACMLGVCAAHAFEQEITIPAEKPEGVTVLLPKGPYRAELTGGGIALVFPINPNYAWFQSVAIGTDVKGGQDVPNIGVICFQPNPPVYSQYEAEKLLREAKPSQGGTSLEFELEQDKEVRF